MKNSSYRVWDNSPANVGGQVMLDWQAVQELVEHGIFLPDILSGKEPYLTAMESTGVKDREGQEIFECDIVEIDWKDSRYDIQVGLVTWDEKQSCFHFSAGSTGEVPWSHKVIGNSFANPELLGES